MKYETYLPGYGTMVVTESVECVDTQETINILSKGGYKFKVDGKVVSKDNVHSAVGKSLGISCDEVRRRITRHKNAYSKVEESGNKKSKDDEHTSQPDTSMRRKVTKIRCIETGDVYKNMTEAGKALGVDPASVSEAIKLGRPRGGYHFERVEE